MAGVRIRDARSGRGTRQAWLSRWRVAGSALALLSWSAAAQAPAVLGGDLLIQHVTIVDTHDGSLRRDRTIRIHDGRIAAIGRGGDGRGGQDVSRIDGKGAFVVPGFLDMHAHPLNSPTPQAALTLMLAHGITGFRQMSGTPQLLALRRAGRLPMGPTAPTLLATPGMVLAGRLATDPAAAMAEVDAQKTAGADFIKVVDLRGPAFYAALDRATADGLRFGGHLPPDIDVREAARRGMRNIEHLGPNDSLLLACSRDEGAIRAAAAAAPPAAATNVNFAASPEVVKRLTVNPMLSLPPVAYARERRVLATYDDAKCRALARDLAARQVWQVPTLVRLRTMELADDPALATQPDLRFVPPDDRRLWTEVGRDFAARLSDADRQTLRDLWHRQLALVKLFDNAGVPMMAGTDLGGQWIVPGSSLHQELDLLAEAGLSPLRILQMTTLNGARFLGRETTMGSVAIGKDADLVLLAGNPAVDVANLHRIVAVVHGGRYHDRAALDRMTAAATQVAAASGGGAMGDDE